MHDQTRLKAKTHIENVIKAVEAHKEKELKEIETKKSLILSKLNNAVQKRD